MPVRTTLILAALTAVGCSRMDDAHATPSPAPGLRVDGIQIAQTQGAHTVPLHSLLVPAAGPITECPGPDQGMGSSPTRLAVIQAGPDRPLQLSGEVVGQIRPDGSLPDVPMKGQLHAPLYDALVDMADATRLLQALCGSQLKGGQPGHVSGRVVLVLDERLPFETVRALVYTAGQAQFDEVLFLVQDPGAAGRALPPLTPGAGLAADRTVAVQVRHDGYRVTTSVGEAPTDLPCGSKPCPTPASYPLAQLQGALATHRAQGRQPLIVVPEAGVSWAPLAHTLAGVSRTADGQDLYTQVVLAGGVPDGAGPDATSPLPPKRSTQPLATPLDGEIAVLRVTLPQISAAFLGATQPPAPAPTKTALGEATVTGGLDRTTVEEVVARSQNQLRYCFAREFTKQPAQRGDLVVSFQIHADGTVHDAVIAQRTLDRPAIETCVLGRFARMRFPQPESGGAVTVTWPVTFEPD